MANNRHERFSSLDGFLAKAAVLLPANAVVPPSPKAPPARPLPQTPVPRHGLAPSGLLGIKLAVGRKTAWPERGRHPRATYTSRSEPMCFNDRTRTWYFIGTVDGAASQIARLQRMLYRTPDPAKPLGSPSLGIALRQPELDGDDAWWIPAARIAWTLKPERVDDLRSGLIGKL